MDTLDIVPVDAPLPIIAGTRRAIVQVDFSDAPSLTQQQFRDETDVNLILKKYLKTGLITHVNEFQQVFADVSVVPDNYQASLNIVMEAQAAFLNLPSDVRKRFDNDPAAFLNFVSDPRNREEMYSLGLAVKPAVEPTIAPQSAGGGSADGAPAVLSPASAPSASVAPKGRRSAPPLVADED